VGRVLLGGIKAGKRPQGQGPGNPTVKGNLGKPKQGEKYTTPGGESLMWKKNFWALHEKLGTHALASKERGPVRGC